MFKTWKENQKLREQLKTKALETTKLIKENEKYKYKLHQIMMLVERFDYLGGNPFTLINKIKKEAGYEK